MSAAVQKHKSRGAGSWLIAYLLTTYDEQVRIGIQISTRGSLRGLRDAGFVNPRLTWSVKVPFQPINPWFAKAFILAGIVGMFVVRAPHIRRSVGIKVISHRKSSVDHVLVALVSTGLFLPLMWIVAPALEFADYALYPLPLTVGAVSLAAGLWLLHRSHTDLGGNWSNTLEIRESHQLVTAGIYRQVRHPMYLALLLYGIGQTLVVPNWVVGPFFLIPFALLVALRLRREEQMMLDRFGQEYEAYMVRTKRIVPGIW